jgi:RNA polymerase sigma-70 factor, ECF subfamily
LKPTVISTPSASLPESEPAECCNLSRLYEERAPHVFRTLRALGVREADLPDVVHDVFLTVHRRRSEVRIYASVRAWVHGICVGTAANYRRKSRHGREQLCAQIPELSFASPDDGASLDLLRLLARLDDDQRAVFVLYEMGDLSMPEVAEALGCPQTTAYSRLYAARKVLRAAVQTRSGGNS